MYKVSELQNNNLAYARDYQGNTYTISTDWSQHPGWAVQQVGQSDLLCTQLETHVKAKKWLYINYGVPTVGWKKSFFNWRTPDKKWYIYRPNAQLGWIIRTSSGLVATSQLFSTRQNALDYINQNIDKLESKYKLDDKKFVQLIEEYL